MDIKEIMVDIKDEDLEELALMYKPYERDLPHVYSFIQTCIQSKKTGMSDFVTIMSPRDCWRKDGTFFALMPHNGHDIFLHSLDPSGKNIVEGLLNTQKFKYPPNQGRPFTMFFGIHETFYPKILDVLTNVLKLDLLFLNPCIMYCLQKEKALDAEISLPPEIYIKEINLCDVSIINHFWDKKFPGSENRHANLLKLNGGYGVYLKSNDQLAAWITLSCLGQLSALQTLEEHKKKGYASLVTKYMTKKLAEKGLHSFATVEIGNTPSKNLFEKLGFKKLGLCQYIGVQII